MRRTLVFHVREKGKGVDTDWILHEYRVLEDANKQKQGLYLQGKFVLCRLFKKEGETNEHKIETNAICEETTDLLNEVSPNMDNLLVTQNSIIKQNMELLAESNSADWIWTANTSQPEKIPSGIITPTYAAHNQVSRINQESLFDGLEDFLGSDYYNSLIS